MPQESARKNYRQRKEHKPITPTLQDHAEAAPDENFRPQTSHLVRLTPADMRRGVILSEVLGRPVSLRRSGRKQSI